MEGSAREIARAAIKGAGGRGAARRRGERRESIQSTIFQFRFLDLKKYIFISRYVVVDW